MILIKVAALLSIFVIFNCVNGFLATRSGVPIRLGNFLSIGNEPETLLGAPGFRPTNSEYTTDGGIKIASIIKNVENISTAVNNLVNLIDDYKGLFLTSSYEVPGRYARWSVGFVAPALQIEGRGFNFTISALNERGAVLKSMIQRYLETKPELFDVVATDVLSGYVIPSGTYFQEEDRSRQPSLFSLVRSIRELFSYPDENRLGLYGAFGYDLSFQFEPIPLHTERSETQRDLFMYLPDEILVIDNQRGDAWTVSYEFSDASTSTTGLPRQLSDAKHEIPSSPLTFEKRDMKKGEFAQAVVRAKEEFRVGNLFEVVLSQTFREQLLEKPSAVFERLCRRNPSPYGFFINLGRGEYLIGASPEMFVRVDRTARGLRVETCPISGTIERGDSPLEDAQQIKKLLLSAKEESELTMCTDVDRNDKSRICIPGSVRVLGRRQIEMYSRLIHTVDHVEGLLREGYDALDAFLCHTWAVTVTGAPKTWAMRFVEKMERSPRRWYGGAVGVVGFDGSMNTGLTLRTIRVENGVAEVRAGATLLHDSYPEAEEAETELKASAMLDAIVRGDRARGVENTVDADAQASSVSPEAAHAPSSHRVLLVDHEDSFVHTLANYIRQTGAEVRTCRSGENLKAFLRDEVDTGHYAPTLAVLSPGPGSPTDFKLSWTISEMMERKIPIFGVCLGLQGLVEHFGGKLGVLDYPMHGKASVVSRDPSPHLGHQKGDILSGLPVEFSVARYHSLHGIKDTLPEELRVLALSGDGTVMALQHAHKPIAAVQFHPESILTLPKHGMKIIQNALDNLTPELYQ